MTSIPAIEQLRLGGQLPSPKGVALAIMQLTQRDDAGIEDIARVASADPSLTSRILRAANSASHGRPLASIHDAIARLGMTATRQLAIGFSLVDQYRQGASHAFDFDRFWSHSLFMAVAMRELGALTRVAAADELFACGLLARIGCLALAVLYPEQYDALLEKALQGEAMLALERETLHTDHLEISAAIMTDCGIPKALAEPARHHETPDAAGFLEGSRPHQLAHLFYQARRMADLGLAPRDQRGDAIAELMLLAGRIGLDANDLGQLFDRAVEQWREWSVLLQVGADAPPAFATMASAPEPRATIDAEMEAIRVLVVDDDPDSLEMLKDFLNAILGQPVHAVADGRAALAAALETQPHVMVTDWRMPGMDGLELTRALRASEWGRSMYVIMLTGVESEEEIVTAFEAGVDDYVTKPVNGRALRARMRAAMHYVKLLANWERDRERLKQFTAELAISNRKLEHFALTDQLTGLPNRRAGMDNLAQAWGVANRSGQPVAAMMIDIDHFKQVNDTHGHAVGDAALREVARALQQSARRDDFVCRMGGEEFLVICHNADLKSAYLAAERLRLLVRGLDIQAGEARLRVSISIGIAGKEPFMSGEEAMVSAADKALYAAKQGGRNRACLSSGGKLRCGQQ